MFRAGPLHGITRAREHALQFGLWYFLSGFPWAVAAFLGAMVLEPGLEAVAVGVGGLLAHFYTLIVVLPAAIVANFVAIRIFRTRSWRREPWRARLAGILGAPLVWAGTLLWLRIGGRAPDLILDLGAGAQVGYVAAIVVFFSNLAILVAWLVPSRHQEVDSCSSAGAARGGAGRGGTRSRTPVRTPSSDS